MGAEYITDIGRDAVFLTLKMAGPLLLAGLIIGLVVSIFQAATQINEQTLSFIPKIVGIVLTLVILSPWLIASFRYFAVTLINKIPMYVLGT